MAKVVEGLGVLLVVAGLLGGAIVGGWQGLVWLSSGVLPDVSVLTALHWLGMAWATNPTALLGVHKALSSIPLAAVLFSIGGVAACLWAK
jgi:hypothetical protein